MTQHLIDDTVNRRLLAVAEDSLTGFRAHPLDDLAVRCDLPVREVQRRLRELMRAGIVRGVRQTLLSSALFPGCLVAWRVPSSKLPTAFAHLAERDPATGHVVIREPEDPRAPGAEYRLWTTLRLPADAPTPESYCRSLARRIGASHFVCMPTVGMFRLSVGHLRRANLPPGTLDADLPTMRYPAAPHLNDLELRVLRSVCAPFTEAEITPDIWQTRARRLNLSTPDYCRVAEHLASLGLLGRFAVVLDHTDPATRAAAAANEAALLMWAVEPGQEEQTGCICARHVCMTHCYYRSGTQPFGGAQIMGMVHGPSRDAVRAHKRAIDSALARADIHLLHSQMHWTVRAHIKPSAFATTRSHSHAPLTRPAPKSSSTH